MIIDILYNIYHIHFEIEGIFYKTKYFLNFQCNRICNFTLNCVYSILKILEGYFPLDEVILIHVLTNLQTRGLDLAGGFHRMNATKVVPQQMESVYVFCK